MNYITETQGNARSFQFKASHIILHESLCTSQCCAAAASHALSPTASIISNIPYSDLDMTLLLITPTNLSSRSARKGHEIDP
jgi:hypothetical protein